MLDSLGHPGAALSVFLVIQAASGGAELQNRTVDPSAIPGAVRAACDAAYAIAAKTPGVSIRRSTGVFGDERLREPVPGCRLTISGSFARAQDSGDAATRLHEGFAARGWREMPAYGADGKDGTAFAFRKGVVACLFRGEWNGGSDQPEIPREDWYRVSVICTSPVPGREKAVSRVV